MLWIGAGCEISTPHFKLNEPACLFSPHVGGFRFFTYRVPLQVFAESFNSDPFTGKP